MSFFLCVKATEWNDKPGSVVNSHLSWQPVAGTAQCHLFKAAGQALMLYCGVAPDRVYRLSQSPERAVSSYLAFPPLPMHAWAVYLCCTFPEVTLGGR